MKKLLGVLLATVILFTSAVIPVCAENIENKDDSRLNLGEIFGYAYTVTFNDNGNITEKEFYENETIAYPAITAVRGFDIRWSLSADEYIAPPQIMPKNDIVIYSYKSSVVGFENYPSVLYADDSVAVKVSSDIAFSGEKSLKYYNMHYSAVTAKPTNWETDYNSYYTLVGSEFVKNNYASAPAFNENTYYKKRSYELEHSLALGTATAGTAYKIKFKYYINKALETDHYLIPYTGHSNLWGEGDELNGKRQFYSASQFNIFANSAIGEWLDGEIYFTASGLAIGGYDNIYIRFGSKDIDLGDSVYFDDFTIEEMVTADFIIPEGFTVDNKNGTTQNGTFTAYYTLNESITAPNVKASDGTPVIWVDEDKIVVTEFKVNGIYSIKLDAKGDLNGDGAVSSLDLALIKLYLVESIDLSTINVANADINENGTVDIADMAYLKLYLAGLVKLY